MADADESAWVDVQLLEPGRVLARSIVRVLARRDAALKPFVAAPVGCTSPTWRRSSGNGAPVTKSWPRPRAAAICIDSGEVDAHSTPCMRSGERHWGRMLVGGIVATFVN